MLSLMDYSILNASGELSPPQFLHIHVAVCLKKNKLEESDGYVVVQIYPWFKFYFPLF